jgi:hypothetical protein
MLSLKSLQELGKQNPELLTLINANQTEFLRIINEPVPPEQVQEVQQQIAQFTAGLDMDREPGNEHAASPM